MKYNKWLSRRFLAAFWAAMLASYIVGTRQAEFVEIAKLCVVLVAIWAGFESALKKWFKAKEE